ncbi:unnamed protein product [Adineta ricciae]|uniref:Uncharacterized protein n=1 Tax=Adineta ricciae TaxID=249248 RepID=A0A815QIS2_ADIRI|nr:unnamed protein product [Adineta ricciae]CAF1529325.1 unnamed protein product [Adineta ricciae]
MANDVNYPITSSSVEFREKIFLQPVVLICINASFNDDQVEQLKLSVKEIHNITDLDESVDFITDLDYGKVFVVFEESTKDYVVSIFNEFERVEEIYIYCTSKTKYNHRMLNTCSKYKGVFTDFPSLRQQLERATKNYVRDSLTVNLISEKRVSTVDNVERTDDDNEFNTQEASVMYHRLIMTTLMEMKEDEPKDMIDFCRTQYADDQSALTAVQEFEQDYQNHSPIWWYTREGFLYKLLNRSLREQDIYALYSLRTFIRHLYDQIFDMFVKQHVSCSTTTFTIVTFYRGQQMATQTFERIKSKRGGLLSFSNFLSTTTNRDLAVIYAGNTLNDQHLTAVLFQLDVDIHSNEQPFAAIDHISHFGTAENEYLFAMGSTFKIDRVEKLNDEVWSVILITTNEFDAKLQDLTNHIINHVECDDLNLQLGKILWTLNENRKAEFFYLKSLEKAVEWEFRARVLQELGTVCMDNSERALDYFQQALELVQQNIQTDYHQMFGSIYNNISAIYQTKAEYDLALVYLKESLARELCSSQPDKRKLSVRYHNLGMILLEQDEKIESERYLKRALDIALEILPSIHPNIAIYYHSLASCMSAIGRFVEAVDYEQKAVNIDLHCLPPDHQQTQKHQKCLKKYQDALEVMITIANMDRERGIFGLVLGNMTFTYPRRK